MDPNNTNQINQPKQAINSADSKTYTLMHGSEKDCWMAIDGKVYNVTEHPRAKAIIGGCAKDATLLFNECPTNSRGSHPAQAKELLNGFYIGNLKK